jgi:hypothetical protein
VILDFEAKVGKKGKQKKGGILVLDASESFLYKIGINDG